MCGRDSLFPGPFGANPTYYELDVDAWVCDRRLTSMRTAYSSLFGGDSAAAVNKTIGATIS